MSNFNTRVHTSSSLPLLVGAAKSEQIRTAPTKPGTDPTAFDRVLDRQHAEQKTSASRNDRRDIGRQRRDTDRSSFQPTSARERSASRDQSTTRDRGVTGDRQNDMSVSNDRSTDDRKPIANDGATPTKDAAADAATTTTLEGEAQTSDEVSAAAATVAALMVSAPATPVIDEAVSSVESELAIEASADTDAGAVEPMDTDGLAAVVPSTATQVAQTTEGLDIDLIAEGEMSTLPAGQTPAASSGDGSTDEVEPIRFASSSAPSETVLDDSTGVAAPSDSPLLATGMSAPAEDAVTTGAQPTGAAVPTTEAASVTDLPAENVEAPPASTPDQVLVEADTEDSLLVDDSTSTEGKAVTTDEQQPLAQAAPAGETADQDGSSGESPDPRAETPEPVVVADPAATAPTRPSPTSAPSARADGVTGIAPTAPQTSAPVAEPVAVPATASFDGEVWEQVQKAVGLVRQSGQGRHEVSLVLRPDELGSVAVELVQNGDEVAVRIVTQTSAAQDRLDRGRLLAELQSAGIDPASVEIDHRGADGSGDGRNEGNGSSLGGNGSGASDDQSDPPPVRRREPRGFTSSGGLDLAL